MLGWMQPQMAYVEADDGTPFIKGDFIVKSDVGYPNRIPTEIHFPGDYPRSEPWAVQTPARFRYEADRHFYASGRCCLWLPVQSPWRRRDPNAFRSFVDQLVIFYHRQLVMDANPGSAFPGPQWDHGADGYIAYFATEWRLPRGAIRRILSGPAPTQPCPCGSGKGFVQCHQAWASRFRRLAGPEMTALVIARLGK
jgi:hypothetical protein